MSHTSDFWQHLKQYIAARIALGRSGGSITTKELLDFQLAHARARDAVHAALPVEVIRQQLSGYGVSIMQFASQAANRIEYLQRPDKGRKLNQVSADSLQALPQTNYDICLVVADGLSSVAIEKNIKPFFDELILRFNDASYQLAPICLVQQGRVAIGDDIACLLHSRM
jgi:ethanolamine ammonia-lyase small subunit